MQYTQLHIFQELMILLVEINNLVKYENLGDFAPIGSGVSSLAWLNS
jgi:hypothetical protein